MIELINISTGEAQPFEIGHAARVLAYEAKYNKKNWKLSDKYYQDENGEIKRREIKDDSRKTERKGKAGSGEGHQESVED
jgi:hypothetical protein